VSTDGIEGAAEWKVFGERTLYEHPWVQLVQVDVEQPGNERFWHHVVRLQRCAVAVVLDDQDRVLLLGRHRFVVDQVGWELPGGFGKPGEDPAETAARETEEETGWRPVAPMRHLVTFQPMVGMVDSPHDVFVAEGADYVGAPTDAAEAGPVRWVPLTEIPTLIDAGLIAGSGSLVGLLHVLATRRS
jgi:8-oxo-dGTP pyrophosphatase MutT (NUDIX family)